MPHSSIPRMVRKAGKPSVTVGRPLSRKAGKFAWWARPRLRPGSADLPGKRRQLAGGRSSPRSRRRRSFELGPETWPSVLPSAGHLGPSGPVTCPSTPSRLTRRCTGSSVSGSRSENSRAPASIAAFPVRRCGDRPKRAAPRRGRQGPRLKEQVMHPATIQAVAAARRGDMMVDAAAARQARENRPTRRAQQARAPWPFTRLHAARLGPNPEPSPQRLRGPRPA
jgi:hypothetical protein